MIKKTVSAITMAVIGSSSVIAANVASAQERMVNNDYWWPNRLSLEPLRSNTAGANPAGDDFDYAEAFESLDLEAVKADLLRQGIKASNVSPFSP